MAIHVVFIYDVGISNDNVSGVNWYLLRMCGPILSAKILLGRGPLQKTLQDIVSAAKCTKHPISINVHQTPLMG